jgi:signal transduction histidine kinase/CheY-like chemotaxis protein
VTSVEGDPLPRTVELFERMAEAAVAPLGEQELFERLLGIFFDAARVDVAVLRASAEGRLVSRAAVGLEAEVAAGFSLTLDEAAHGWPASGTGASVVAPVASDVPAWSDGMRRRGVRALWCVALVPSHELVGAIYLGTLDGRAIAEEDLRILTRLAPLASQAIARRAAEEALRRGVETRDNALGVVAHDLRNPLNIISVASKTIVGAPEPMARRLVEKITRAVERASRMAEDLLDIHAIEAGRFSVERRTLDPRDLIAAAVESQRGLAEGATVSLSADVAADLPPIRADRGRVLAVFENLIGNALKFTKPGGNITVGAASRERELVFWVKDDGAGIAPEALPHLFDRFWQADNKDRTGIGLGLTICKAIVEGHGGRIWAESALGAGTTMSFTLPLAAPSAEVATILLVDDRPENLVTLAAILERDDYRLVKATSGVEALRLCLRERFTLAIIDVAMPTMDGFEVAKHLKGIELTRDMPIIFLTAFGDDPAQIHRAYGAGGVDYLVKPLDPVIVRQKVDVFVQLMRRRTAST